MIRKANKGDLEKIMEAAAPLYAQSKHPFELNPEVWIRSWAQLLDGGAGLMILSETEEGEVQGVIGGVFFPDLNTGLLKASELVWYVVPKFRRSAIGWTLYQLFMREAKQRHVAVVTMSHLVDNDSTDTLRKFYERHGYRKLETVWVKDIM